MAKNGYLLHQVKMLPFKFEAKQTLCLGVTHASLFVIFVSAFMPDGLLPYLCNNFGFLTYRLFLPTQAVIPYTNTYKHRTLDFELHSHFWVQLSIGNSFLSTDKTQKFLISSHLTRSFLSKISPCSVKKYL